MKRILGRTIGIGAVVFFVAAAFFSDYFQYAVDVIAHPWAYSLRGETTLTGHWRGHVDFEGRVNRELRLEIERNPLKSYRRIFADEHPLQGAFTGWAKMQDDFGSWVHYDLVGNTNRSGSEVIIQIQAIDAKASPERQTVLQELKGVWKGQTLELEGVSSMTRYDGKRYNFSEEDSVLSAKARLIRQ